MVPMISARGLGKRYRLGMRMPYRTLRETIANAATAALRLTPAPLRGGKDCIWALEGISFDVRRGTTLGIIGRNGAGKTTLLKILSRVTEPTTGEARIRGRIASLLEVGTGFHPELTGRENIFLNGAILGMSRSEIRSRFDEIVSFAEVDQFIDTPVKRYSSGMYVRLAFSVAAHLDPEVLIIDEILSVGDHRFQKKCLGRMREIGSGGRTILFVSHNMSAVASLCSEAICLEKGRLIAQGPVEETVAAYLKGDAAESRSAVDLTDFAARFGPGEFSRLLSIGTLAAEQLPQSTFALGAALLLELRFRLREPVTTLEIGFAVFSSQGDKLQTFVGQWEGLESRFCSGTHRVTCRIDPINLFPGSYSVTPWLKRHGQGVDDQVPQAIEFAVIGGKVLEHSAHLEQYPNSGVFQRSVWTAAAE